MSDLESLPARIGFLADGDPDTKLMTALYEQDDIGVRLKVPYALWTDDERGRWWSQGTMYVDDPDRTKYSYSPPPELDYYDNKGAVGFVGCRSGAASQRFGGFAPDMGVGVIHARYALEGAIRASNYTRLNGLRSEIDGLGQWLGYSALKTFIKLPANGAGQEITTTAAAADDMPLGRPLNLKAVAHALGSGLDSSEVTFRSRVYLETFTKTRKSWEDHLTLHYGVRDLLRVASWQPTTFQSHKAASFKETLEVNGNEQQTWREVRTALTGIAESTWKTNDRFLFSYGDIGSAGVAKWLKLARTYTRGIEPLIGLLDLEGATVDAHVMQLGIAIEAIGYQALLDSGKSAGAANGTQMNGRISYLLTEVAGAISFNSANFAQDFADSYNSVKHANRAPVVLGVKVDHYRQGVEMVRAWIALRLGLKAKVLSNRW